MFIFPYKETFYKVKRALSKSLANKKYVTVGGKKLIKEALIYYL